MPSPFVPAMLEKAFKTALELKSFSALSIVPDVFEKGFQNAKVSHYSPQNTVHTLDAD